MNLKPAKLCHVALAALVALNLAAPGTLAQQAHKEMVHIKIKLIDPAPAAGTFAAEPKEYWRSGKVFARMAEGPDYKFQPTPKSKPMSIQQLMIINEPDIWLLDLMSKKGKHIVDPGPTFVVHMNMFDKTLPELGKLEYGGELAFFKEHSARAFDGPAVNGKPTTKFELTLSEHQLTLLVDKSNNPVRMTWINPAKKSYTLEYMVYEMTKFDPSLFKLPSGFQMQEIKVQKPKKQTTVRLPVPPPPTKGAPQAGSTAPSKQGSAPASSTPSATGTKAK